MNTIDFDETEARIAARDAAIAALLAGGERPRIMHGECGGPITLFIHRDTYPERVGMWRLTRFDATGEPFGHTDCSSFESALREAAHWGVDLVAEMLR